MNLKYADITERVIGSAFEVHKFLGNGFQEVIYQRALAYEMQQVGLSFAREISQDIFYKDLRIRLGRAVQILWWRRRCWWS
jgi:GxxExxY protein